MVNCSASGATGAAAGLKGERAGIAGPWPGLTGSFAALMEKQWTGEPGMGHCHQHRLYVPGNRKFMVDSPRGCSMLIRVLCGFNNSGMNNNYHNCLQSRMPAAGSRGRAYSTRLQHLRQRRSVSQLHKTRLLRAATKEHRLCVMVCTRDAQLTLKTRTSATTQQCCPLQDCALTTASYALHADSRRTVVQ
jgi:hypothetical protein